MKRIFTLALSMMTAAMSMTATDYQDRLQVIVNGEASSQKATITVNEQGDSRYTLSLKNFVLKSGEQEVGVGNIILTDIEGAQADGKTVFSVSQQINITEGDRQDVAVWTGPMLGPIPVEMRAELSGDKLYTVIDIDMMASLGQIIKVIFGTGGYQIENSDFEEFHNVADKYVEPNGWHSFESATGDLAALAGHHLEQSDDVRPGSPGTKSVRLYSTSLFGVIANGTMTTGRMNAGSMSATDSKNNAYLDMSITEKDANGDPFYAILDGRPDSIAVWVKFKQGKANDKHPYATMSAVITDGTYYQDPEDKDYTNIIARAKATQIATEGGQWQRISAPFSYEADSGQKAILVTLSTNADPGQGSAGDELFVDDMQLIYNAKLSNMKVKGVSIEGFDKDNYEYTMASEGTISINDIDVTTDGTAATVEKMIESQSNGAKVTINVTAGDLADHNTYTLVISGVTTEGIDVTSHNSAPVIATYSISGQRIDNRNTREGLRIEKHADGKTVKLLR
ncbi:MAG: PCMD domain-containing protein [Prevotella sp.]|nr:PCMD domain-containing protein [Prevotella sp.]